MVIHGWRNETQPLGMSPGQCPSCGPGVMVSRGYEVRKKTLFFVPIFTLGTTTQTQCTRCGKTWVESATGTSKVKTWWVVLTVFTFPLALIMLIFPGWCSLVGILWIVVLILLYYKAGRVQVYAPQADIRPAPYGAPAGVPAPGGARVCPRCGVPASFDASRGVFYCAVCSRDL